MPAVLRLLSSTEKGMEDSNKKRGKIGPGYRFGKLTVEGKSDRRKNGYIVWNCRCECGNTILLDTRNIQRETVLDCGCSTNVRPGQKDLTGRRFGRLIALRPDGTRDKFGNVMWICQCDCGNVVTASRQVLTAGYKKSCGCLGRPPLKDLVGKRFGKLTVIEYAGKEKGVHRWKCLCDCGNETVVSQTLLQKGRTRSCGCLLAATARRNLKLAEGTSLAKLEANRTRRFSNNSSGYTGVYLQKRTGKWAAQITFKKKTYYLGSYATIEEAIEARKKGEGMFEEFLDRYYKEHPEDRKA